MRRRCMVPSKTLFNRFVRWAKKGIGLDIVHSLAAEGGPSADLLLDSTHAKAHRRAAGGKGGAGASHWIARRYDKLAANFLAAIALAAPVTYGLWVWSLAGCCESPRVGLSGVIRSRRARKGVRARIGRSDRQAVVLRRSGGSRPGGSSAQGHPLRVIRRIADEVPTGMSGAFDAAHARFGRPSTRTRGSTERPPAGRAGSALSPRR